MRRIKLALNLLGFAAPALLIALTLSSDGSVAWLAAWPVQVLGLLAERWFFFAQARHPQNLYYQVVS
jgi:DMSO reductase anchor subunit